jgi:hypothetical protein
MPDTIIIRDFMIPPVFRRSSGFISCRNSLDVSAERFEFRDYPTVASINVIHPVDGGFSLRNEAGQDK